MSWQRRERNAARTLCTKRVVRARGESRPDVEPIVLADGTVIQPEIKHRAKLPRLLSDALAQAKRYSPLAIALAVVSQRGGRQLACLDLADLARLLGILPPVMPRERRRRAAKPAPVETPKQLMIPGA